MNSPIPNIPPSNTLGKTSLVLGVLASFFVVLVGLCAGVGQQQGWLKQVGPLLFVVGGAFTFLGAVAVLLGLLGLLTRPRTTALAGLILGVITVLLFAAILNGAK